MKCPWMKITKAYADYSEGDASGRPIQVVEEEYKECIKGECPFYYSCPPIEKQISEKTSITNLCLRAFSEVKWYE